MTTNLPTLAYRDDGKGSPWIVTCEGLDAITRLTRNAVPVPLIASHLGMSSRTLFRLLEDDEDVQEAVALGKAGLQEEIVGMILTDAREGDGPSRRFLAKTMCGLREQGPPTDPAPATDQPQINIHIPPALSIEELNAMRDITPPDDEQTHTKKKGLTR